MSMKYAKFYELELPKTWRELIVYMSIMMTIFKQYTSGE